MVASIDGYDLAYTHRGSWKAHRIFRGKIIDEIPVAWTRDYAAGNPPSLIVWFKDENEAGNRLATKGQFVVALSEKKLGGASAKDIRRLFEVSPVETVPATKGTRSGLLCVVVGKCPPRME
ncbi:hypothetical protein [Jiella pelagia]|uniref:Uncharacterized protein n=1 Tax=Jiella pelagia TaxID=2986949 RepID=A0ABY7C4I4_9HYPH|nr:hypothetical protein [Jiella pelagia]WAP70116.1 hypothetical protein OH818_08285 [Jiella pelagia]